jgi:hypothetical protein
MRKATLFTFVAIALAAFMAGHWSNSSARVKADSVESPDIKIEPIRGDTALTVYYPTLKKLFVYQTPFVGLPTWSCSYSIQLSTPGGIIERQPCSRRGQQF